MPPRAPELFRKTVFPNGLTLVTERQPQFRSLSIGVWVKAGTRHELPGEAGVSHFLEHMLFKGTGSRSALDIARAVDRVGGELNAFTAREYTCFHMLLLGRDLGLAAEILADILLDSRFDAEELERERRVILQEISMVEESPEELAHDLFFEKIYGGEGRGGHGLGRPILGTESSVRRLTRAGVLRYFRERYRPDQLVVAVAGDVSHEAVRRKLAPLLRPRWPGRPARARGPVPFEAAPKALTPGFWWCKRPTEQVHLIWGVRGPSYSSKDRFAAFLLNVYLGGGMSSALFQEIREKKALAYSVYSTLTPYSDSGTFSVYAATGMAQVPLCLRLIEEAAGKLCEEPLSIDELRMAQDNFKGTVLLSADSAEARMSSIARNEIFFGRYVPVEETCESIDAVTPADVRRVARGWLKDGSRSVLALGPSPSPVLRSRLKPEMLAR